MMGFIQSAEQVVLAAVAYVDSGDAVTQTRPEVYDDLAEAVRLYKMERAEAEAQATLKPESFRCYSCKAAIERGERCSECGRGWFVESAP